VSQQNSGLLPDQAITHPVDYSAQVAYW